MANKKHLDLLLKGKDAWNDWREENPGEMIDLIGAKIREKNLSGFILSRGNLSMADLSASHLYQTDLYKANLSGAILQNTTVSHADFSEADLTQADLSQTNIRRANLSDAKLQRANFSDARLVESDLSLADLTETNLTRAKLTGTKLRRANLLGSTLVEANLVSSDLAFANFAGADLRGADLHNATLAFTILGNTNLQDARHLDSCTHRAPSIIDQMTLVKSPNLPENFLRGCGLSDEFIQSLPSLFWSLKSEDFFSCFISYSHDDAEFVHRLYDALQSQGIRCWLDEIELAPGDDFYEAIDIGVNTFDKFILCCSKSSLEKSLWVDRELDKALQKEEQLFRERGKKAFVLIPLMIDDYVFTGWQGGKKSVVLSRFIGDFTQWQTSSRFDKEFKKLLRALRPSRNIT